jgi:divalent metal cation (Fe/Co/Zn/Cd) transporter
VTCSLVKPAIAMENLYKKALYLEYFTVGYNVLEAVVSILLGSLSNSIALIGFGLDSTVESLSAFVLIWHLTQPENLTPEDEGRIEKKATKFVTFAFFLMAGYILFESLRKLIHIIHNDAAEPSLPGIILSAFSLIIMPILALQKCKLGYQLNSKALIADSKETLVCSFLSLVLLLGLGGNYLFNSWQADPFVGFVIVLYLVREGLEIWEEANEEDSD